MAIDPVCKMNVDPEKATVQTDYAGQLYYFCSDACHKKFIEEPKSYTSGAASADHSCCGGHGEHGGHCGHAKHGEHHM